jgi:hypothetical protein
VQSFSSPSAAGLMTFYCLMFEDPPAWRARSPYLYPPGTGSLSYTTRHWVPFSSPPTTRRVTWNYSTQPPHRPTVDSQPTALIITSRHGQCRKHRSSCFQFNCCRGNMFVCEAFIQYRLPYTCLFRGRFLAAGVDFSHYLTTGRGHAVA